MKIAAGFLMAGFLLAETKVTLAGLPAPVQAAVREQTKAAILVGLSKEVTKGKTVYEVETKVQGRTRDLILDSQGAIVETEDEVDLDTIPPAAKKALQDHAAGGDIQKVEKLTRGPSVAYEAAIKAKTGKVLEVSVNPDGTRHKQ